MAHHAIQVRQYLDDLTFPKRCVGRHRLATEVFRLFLVGQLKNVVFQTKPETNEDLTTGIIIECANIICQTISMVQQEFVSRMRY